MKNILKLSFGLSLVAVLVLSLAVGVGSANAADLTWSANQTVSLSGLSDTNFTILSGSTATSLAVAATTITVVVPASSTFGLIAPGRNLLTNDIGIVQTCSGSNNSVTVTGAQTVVFTPSATLCTISGGGGLSSGGGGGSSSSTVAQSTTPVTLTITPEVTMTTSTPGCSGGNKYNTSTGALCVSSTVTTSVPGCGNRTSGFSTATGTSCVGNVVGSSVSAAAGPYNFGAKTLKSGSKGDAVMELQRFLNTKLNLGLVLDGKLGPKTIAVVKKWQKDNGLVADGLIGPKTKALMNSQ